MVGRIQQGVSWLLAAGLASAQYDIDNLTFGKNGVVSPSGQGIPGWKAASVNHKVQMLSDRIILTPPWPGNAKGSLWGLNAAKVGDWTAELSFRASGQEEGSGNLQIWYVKDRDAVGTNSVYNVGKFDGLVIVVDQYNHQGGAIRGFLNDGSQDFQRHPQIDSLAFGKCDYHYRNLGRTSPIKISNVNGLTVSVDGHECFSSNKVSLPADYHFGITASTGEHNPDSFEIHKFHVQAGVGTPAQNQDKQSQQAPNSQAQQTPNSQSQQNQHPFISKMDAFPDAPHAMPDSNAEEIKQQDQFADLHNRIQHLHHQLANVYRDFQFIADKMDAQHQETMTSVKNIGGSRDTGMPPELVGKIQRMSDKMDALEKTVDFIKRQTDHTGTEFTNRMHKLDTVIGEIHGGVHEHLPDRVLDIVRRHSVQFGKLVIIMILVQVSIVGAYFYYKKRRNSGPKKFL